MRAKECSKCKTINEFNPKKISKEQTLIERKKMIEFYAKKYMKLKNNNNIEDYDQDLIVDEFDEEISYEEKIDIKELGL